MFIVLTDFHDGTKIRLNVNQIIFYSRSFSNYPTSVGVCNKYNYDIKETPEQIDVILRETLVTVYERKDPQ